MTAREKIVKPYAWEQLQGQRTFKEAEIDSIISEVGKLPEGKIKVKRWDDERSRNVSLVVERRDQLAYRLDGALALLAHHDILNSGESVSDTDKRLRAIRAATGELLLKLTKANVIHKKTTATGGPKPTNRKQLELSYDQFESELATSETGHYLVSSIREFYNASDKNKAALNVFGGLQPGGQEIFAYSILIRCAHAIELLGSITNIAIQKNGERKAISKAGENAPHKADTALDQCIEILGNIYCQIWEKPSAGFARYANTSRPDNGEERANKGKAYGPFIRFAHCSLKVAGIDLEGDAIARILLKLRRARKKKD